MKKKILIVSHAMELGGVERSLIGLLESIDYSRIDVDLFLLRHEGELLLSIPDKVHLLPQVKEYTVLARPMIQILKEGHFLLGAARMYAKLKAAKFNKKNHYNNSDVELEYSHKCTYKLMPDIQPNTVYDLAVSFLTPHYIVMNKVRATKKAAWIHTDYSKIEIDVQSEQCMWRAYDYIISISQAVTEAFVNRFPELIKKIVLIKNILPKELVEKQAMEFEVNKEMPEGNVRLLSIGRFCTPKNFDSIPEICSRILEMGINIKWYIIGYGPDEELIKKGIAQYHVEDSVILLGKKKNPYPYIKACELYIQPSRYEGNSVTVREAQMLRKPVVITNYSTAGSQIEDKVDGLITDLDNYKCAIAIKELIQNKLLMKRLIQNCSVRDYSNFYEIEKFYQLIGLNDIL